MNATENEEFLAHEKPLLMTAIASGAPRGVLNLLTSNTQTAAIVKYMNRSNSPRNVIQNVESLLDDRRIGIEHPKKGTKTAVPNRSIGRGYQSDSSENEENDLDQNRSRVIRMINMEHSATPLIIDSDSNKETGKRRGRSKSYGNTLVADTAALSALKTSFSPRRVVSANARAAAAALSKSAVSHGPLIGSSFGFSADAGKRKEDIHDNTVDFSSALLYSDRQTEEEEEEDLPKLDFISPELFNEEQVAMSIPLPLLPPQPARETTNMILLKPGNPVNPISSATYTSAIMQQPDSVGKSISIVGKVLLAPPSSIVVPVARAELEHVHHKEMSTKVEQPSIAGTAIYKGAPLKSNLQATRPTSASPSIGAFSLRTKRNQDTTTDS
jgi:hypothetical protein